MSGSVNALPEVLLGSVAEDERPDARAPPRPTGDESTWTVSRTLRRLSQLTFAYGVSAAIASVSAAIMSIPGGSQE